MAEAAMRDLGFPPAQAVVIGDSDADMGLAQAAGLKGVRIGAGEGNAKNFLEAARRACALFS
jgi:phosphoglycolate phosphatase-like HAD superfamily hydrolase